MFAQTNVITLPTAHLIKDPRDPRAGMIELEAGIAPARPRPASIRPTTQSGITVGADLSGMFTRPEQTDLMITAQENTVIPVNTFVEIERIRQKVGVFPPPPNSVKPRAPRLLKLARKVTALKAAVRPVKKKLTLRLGGKIIGRIQA